MGKAVREGKALSRGKRVIRSHERADTHVAAHRHFDLTRRCRHKAETDVDCFVDEAGDDVCRGRDFDIQMQCRMALRKRRQKGRQEGKTDTFHRGDADGTGLEPAQHVELRHCRFER